MKSQIATTREQSDRLLKCGVPAESADMMITPHNTLSTNPYKSVFRDRGHSPAWSLGRLLEMLPKKIKNDIGLDLYTFKIRYDFTIPLYPWVIDYKHRLDASEHFSDASPIGVCVKAIEWLTERGYALNGIKEGGEE